MKIPEELRNLQQWHCWKSVDGTKIPVQVNGQTAKSNDPTTWTDFNTADAASVNFSGLAFEIAEPYCGIDLDNCLDDDGVKQWAWSILGRFDGVAYAEISPSGKGIKLLTRARKVDRARCVHKIGDNKQQVECYDGKRFWTVTGEIYNRQTNIGDGQEAVDWLCREYLMPVDPAPYNPPALSAQAALEQRAARYIDNADPAGEGDRNNAAFRLAGHLRKLDDLGERLSESRVLELVRLWNSRNPEPLPDSEIEKVVSSAGRNGTPRQVEPARVFEPIDDSDVDLSRLMRSISGQTVFPADCLKVPGLIGDIIEYNLATAHYPLPELALAGAISLMSTVTGGKVEGLRCRSNLYVMGLAPSGGGKDHSRKINRKILLHAGHGHICGPERIGSHAGIVSALAENWNTLFQIDEIGRMLATMHSAQMSPHLYNIASVLMQVYSSADDIWQADAYGDRKKVKTLEYPHCVVYGSSVPDGFWESLTKQNLSDGLIGRFLVFEEPEYVNYQNPADVDLPESIVTRAREWLELRTHDGNLSGVSRHDAAHPRRLDVSEEARNRLHQHAVDISEKRKKEDPIEAAIWSRHAEKTNKLALLFACSRWQADGVFPSINLEDADKAVRLNNWLTRRMLIRSGAYVSESQVEKDRLKVLRLIQTRPEWTRTELTRKTQWLRSRDRTEVLNDLLEAQLIVTEQRERDSLRTVTIIRAV